MSARRDEGFLLLDADTGMRPAAERICSRWWSVSARLPAAVKLALRRGSIPLMRLRAEFPLPEESAAAGDRIRGHLEAMRSASHRLHELGSPAKRRGGDGLPGTGE